jgi:glycosyltransferase involved in cell wall biosynthesis
MAAQTRSLEQEMAAKDLEIQGMAAQVEALRVETSSITFQLTARFHKRIIEKYFPHNTRRRRYYDFGLKSGRILVNEGWKGLWGHYRERKQHRSQIKDWQIYCQSIPLQSSTLPERATIPAMVSIIIPTKNAGFEFDYTLEKIRHQKGISNIEIVIVDSGSTDITLDLAKKYNCTIFSIKPEDFNHGLTRNYGAEHTNGDFILFMVQDAIPISEYWLYNIVKALKSDEKMAAVTCRQVPKSDADLFSCYSMWYHYQAMEFNSDRFVQIQKEDFDKLSFAERRKFAGIDDVCSCFKKEMFQQFKFKKLSFAEDLDLGMRLLENGYRLGFLYSAGVIHSHNRDPDYFLRRYYVDSKALTQMFYLPMVEKQDINFALQASIQLYLKLKEALDHLSRTCSLEIPVDTFFSKFKVKMNSANIETCNLRNESNLEKILVELSAFSIPVPIETKLFNEDFLNILNNFHVYAKNRCEQYCLEELIETIYKLYVMYCGSYLGNLYYSNSTNDLMRSIDKILTKEV